MSHPDVPFPTRRRPATDEKPSDGGSPAPSAGAPVPWQHGATPPTQPWQVRQAAPQPPPQASVWQAPQQPYGAAAPRSYGPAPGGSQPYGAQPYGSQPYGGPAGQPYGGVPYPTPNRAPGVVRSLRISLGILGVFSAIRGLAFLSGTGYVGDDPALHTYGLLSLLGGLACGVMAGLAGVKQAWVFFGVLGAAGLTLLARVYLLTSVPSQADVLVVLLFILPVVVAVRAFSIKDWYLER